MKITAALAVTIFVLGVALRLQHSEMNVLKEKNHAVATLNGQLIADLKQAADTASDLYRQRNELNLIVKQQNEKMLQLEVQRDDFYKQIRDAEQNNPTFKSWSDQRINATAIRMLSCRTTGSCDRN